MTTVPLRALAALRVEKVRASVAGHVDLEAVESGASGRWSRCAEEDRVGDALSVRPGDVLFARLRPYLRKTFLADGPLTASTEFVVLNPRGMTEPRYLGYVVRDPLFADHAVAHSYGTKMPRVAWEGMRGYAVRRALPGEQRAIADFLDRESTRIGDAVATSDAVHSSLASFERDIADRLVEGLPTVPLKTVASIHSGVTLNEARTQRNGTYVPYLRVANVKAGWLDLQDVKEVLIAGEDVERYTLRNGDLLLTEGGDIDKLGRGALWDGANAPCVFQNHIFAVRPRGDAAVPAFLSWATRSSAARTYFEATASRITNIASTNRSKLGRWPVPSAPVDEQRRRVERAESEWHVAQRARHAAARLGERLAAYRDSLIHEAVTGKLDVTRVSDQQMDERLHAATEHRLDEVAA